jgi:hypothetical protein
MIYILHLKGQNSKIIDKIRKDIMLLEMDLNLLSGL